MNTSAELMDQHLAALDARIEELLKALRLVRTVALVRGDAHAVYVSIAEAALFGVLP